MYKDVHCLRICIHIQINVYLWCDQVGERLKYIASVNVYYLFTGKCKLLPLTNLIYTLSLHLWTVLWIFIDCTCRYIRRILVVYVRKVSCHTVIFKNQCFYQPLSFHPKYLFWCIGWTSHIDEGIYVYIMNKC